MNKSMLSKMHSIETEQSLLPLLPLIRVRYDSLKFVTALEKTNLSLPFLEAQQKSHVRYSMSANLTESTNHTRDTNYEQEQYCFKQ